MVRGTDRQRSPGYPRDGALEERLVAYRAAEALSISRTTAAVRSLAASGGVAVLGAGAKGVTFLNLADPEAANVSCVIDVNPYKQGKFIPGTTPHRRSERVR